MKDTLTETWKNPKHKTSPIITIILLIAITVILAAVLCTSPPPAKWPPFSSTRRNNTPSVGATYQPYDRNFSVRIEKIDPDATNNSNVRYYLLDRWGNKYHRYQGELTNINQLDFQDPETNITFQDNDQDGKLSSGDIFFIKHVDYGGHAVEGYALLLEFKPTGESMNGAGTIFEDN